MVLVQKLSALACGLHDGLMAEKKQLTDIQKRYMIRFNIFINILFKYNIYNILICLENRQHLCIILATY